MNALVLIGLLAMTMVVAAPTAAAHTLIGYPDPVTGECTVHAVPGSDDLGHRSVTVHPCAFVHF